MGNIKEVIEDMKKDITLKMTYVVETTEQFSSLEEAEAFKQLKVQDVFITGDAVIDDIIEIARREGLSPKERHDEIDKLVRDYTCGCW